MSIIVENLTKVYGRQKAVDGITFEARENEIIGLLGPNGAGKTTTMKILTCFMPPTSGSATICGLDILKNDLDVRRIIGYLAEHNPLYGTMYVKEYLSFVGKIHSLDNLPSRIKNIIEKVGLGAEQKKKISELSKGYKQRVGLAQAIIHDPKVLILDEPISGLDPNQLIEIRSLISDLKKDKTIIFSSHILQEVESICDRVVILDKGKIVADDNMDVINRQDNQYDQIEIDLMHPIDIKHATKELSGMSIQHLSSNKYLIEAGTSKDVREDIFDYMVSSGNKLLGMKIKDHTLENVFKTVTKS